MQNTARRARIAVSDDGRGIVSHAGALLLTETARVTGLASGLSAVLGRWRPGRAVHDPGKTLLDLAVAVALGGDCLADAGVLRAEPGLFGPVASDPVTSRLVARLAADAPAAMAAIGKARAAARQRAWQLAGGQAPGEDGRLIPVDIDATLVTAHSGKEQAAPTWKKTYGFHPLAVFADHGPAGSGEPLAIMLRPGNAGSNTAAGHIAATRLALGQLPRRLQRRVLIRADSGGGTHEFLNWLTRPGRRLRYSVGFTMTGEICDAIVKVPARAWTPAYDGDGQVRDGAWVAELTGLLDLSSWPEGMRVIARKERPHPGAQLRFTDINGHRFTYLGGGSAAARQGPRLNTSARSHRRSLGRRARSGPRRLSRSRALRSCRGGSAGHARQPRQSAPHYVGASEQADWLAVFELIPHPRLAGARAAVLRADVGAAVVRRAGLLTGTAGRAAPPAFTHRRWPWGSGSLATRPGGDSSPALASGPARGTPGHRGHCRVSPVEQFRRASGWVMAFSDDGEAMDKQPGQRQCDGQQQPGPQPGRQKNPHAQRPFFPPGGRHQSRPALICGTSYRTEPCISGVTGSHAGRGRACPIVLAALPAARRANHHVDGSGPCPLRGTSRTASSSCGRLA
jgi:Transposase DDE domain group 1